MSQAVFCTNTSAGQQPASISTTGLTEMVTISRITQMGGCSIVRKRDSWSTCSMGHAKHKLNMLPRGRLGRTLPCFVGSAVYTLVPCRKAHAFCIASDLACFLLLASALNRISG